MSLPGSMRPLMPLFEAAARKYSTRHAVRPIVLAAICHRETRGGNDCTPPGPGGTGDFVARHGSRYENPNFKCVGETTPKGDPNGPRLKAYVPADGQGFGRGLMQIDFGYHTAWCLLADDQGMHLWKKAAENIDKGASIYADYLRIFGGDELCAIAAYNAGPGNVREVISELLTSSGNADADRETRIYHLNQVTTHRDYVSSVLERVIRFQAPPDPPPPAKPKGVA
jgi:hypothetical protein